MPLLPILLVFAMGPSHAQKLTEVSPPPSQVVSLTTPPAPGCANLKAQLADAIARLQGYQTMSQKYSLALAGYTDDIANKIFQQWHDDLRGMEGKTVAIPKGRFDAITRGQDQLNTATDQVMQDAAVLKANSDQILNILNQCLSSLN